MENFIFQSRIIQSYSFLIPFVSHLKCYNYYKDIYLTKIEILFHMENDYYVFKMLPPPQKSWQSNNSGKYHLLH